jgi:hypothetical protein
LRGSLASWSDTTCRFERKQFLSHPAQPTLLFLL